MSKEINASPIAGTSWWWVVVRVNSFFKCAYIRYNRKGMADIIHKEVMSI